MSREALPQVGSVLYDPSGVACHVELVALDELSSRDFDSILSANEVNDGKD